MSYSPLWAIAGILLIVLALFDFHTTTTSLKGAGFLSGRLSGLVWKCFRSLLARGSHRRLAAAGPFLLLLLFLTWVSLCWLGWFLVFCGSEGAVVNANTREPAALGERLYFAGYSLTTIGYGDYVPPSMPWQLAGVLAGLNGFFLISLSITYMAPVVSASVEKRRLSLLIHCLGATPGEIIDRACKGGDLSLLAGQLENIAGALAEVSEKHRAYPVLHYFHNDTPATALPLSLASLGEAVTLADFAFPERSETARLRMHSMLTVLDHYLATLERAFIHAPASPPPLPDLEAIEALEKSPRGKEEILAYLEGPAQRRRKLLLAHVLDDGWSWRDAQGYETKD